MLYRVLLEEYERLEILSKPEADDIRAAKAQAKIDFDLKDEKELQKIKNAAKREKESRRQLELRGKYNSFLLKTIREKVHGKKAADKPTAVCLSGGGIRSATFNLGVLQGLARHGLLDKFDYLSTVSGGGYIGSWFSAWINRTGSVEKVQAVLSKDKLFSVLFGLNDFKTICDENEPTDSLDNLEILKAKLEAEKEFFGEKTVGKLSKIKLPEKSVLRKNPAEFYKLKEFAKELCKQLNRIILKVENESEKLKTQLVETENLARSKAKRKIFEDKLFTSKPDETEEIFETDIERHDIEPEEITHLRTFSNYMSPRHGLFSTDTWSLLGVYLRNLLLNWTVFVPFIAAVLLLPKICALLIGFEPSETAKLWILILSLIAGIIGVCNLNAMRPTLSELSWVEQNYEVDDIGSVVSVEPKILRWGVAPLLVLAVGMTIFWFPANRPEGKISLIYFIACGVVLFVGGFLAARILMLFFGNLKKFSGKIEVFFRRIIDDFGLRRNRRRGALYCRQQSQHFQFTDLQIF